jgi:hemerythrin superfamily protein
MSERQPAAPDEDAVELLMHQHGVIHDLFVEVRASGPEARREPFDRLVRTLAVHETAEEIILHPLARTVVPGGAGVVDDRLAEERPAKEMLSRLEALDPSDPRFLPLLDDLRLAVLAHARAEERYEFVKLRESTDARTLARLASLLRAAEAVAPTHPHPSVTTPAENAVAGPVAAIVDRVRDAVRKASDAAP